jgi:hypothetical protein
MAHRTFCDSAGERWDVWDVIPTRAERRAEAATSNYRGPERRRTPDPIPRVRLDRLAHGWLTFEGQMGRLRLAPLPERWEDSTEAELAVLLSRAEPVRAGRQMSA